MMPTGKNKTKPHQGAVSTQLQTLSQPQTRIHVTGANELPWDADTDPNLVPLHFKNRIQDTTKEIH